MSGAFSGATIAEYLAGWLAQFPILKPYAQAISLGLVVVIISYLSLVVGELAPKRLALGNAERIASAVARPMRLLTRLAAPLVRVLSGSTNLLLRLFGFRPSTEPPVTEEEIKVLLEQGTQAAVFEEAEQDMVEGVFSLGDQRGYSLMTPRTEIVWLDINDTNDDILQKISESPYSRCPVCQAAWTWSSALSRRATFSWAIWQFGDSEIRQRKRSRRVERHGVLARVAVGSCTLFGPQMAWNKRGLS